MMLCSIETQYKMISALRKEYYFPSLRGVTHDSHRQILKINDKKIPIAIFLYSIADFFRPIIQAARKSLTMIQECLKQLAGFSGIDFKDKRELGKWVRKRGLDTFTVKYITLKKEGTPTILVAAFVRI